MKNTLCDMFGENPADIEKVENANKQILKVVDKEFIYHNPELIFKSKDELLMAEIKELEA